MLIAAITLSLTALNAGLPPAGPPSILGSRTLTGITFANPNQTIVTGGGTNLTILDSDSLYTIYTDISVPVWNGPAIIFCNGATHQVTGWWFTSPTAPVEVQGTWNNTQIQFYVRHSFKNEMHRIGFFGETLSHKLDGSVDLVFGELVSNKTGAIAMQELENGIGHFSPIETANFKGASVRIMRPMGGITTGH